MQAAKQQRQPGSLVNQMLRSNFESQKSQRKNKHTALKEGTVLEAKRVKLSHKKQSTSE